VLIEIVLPNVAFDVLKKFSDEKRNRNSKVSY